MSIQLKSFASISMATLLGMALSCNAGAEPGYGKARTDRQIEACVAEIARHADYEDASRVIHRVATLNQKNLLETRIGVRTTVHLASADREYRVSCLADTMGKLIDFRITAA
jgi:hypothetical protein